MQALQQETFLAVAFASKAKTEDEENCPQPFGSDGAVISTAPLFNVRVSVKS
jgi:hypothetical protein